MQVSAAGMMDAVNAAEVVRRLGGRAEYADIVRHTSEYDLRTSHDQGQLIRIRRGCYALPDLPVPHQIAAELHGVLSHASAAQALRLEALMPPTKIHVMVPPSASRRRRSSGVVMHYATTIAERVTSPLRTVADCAATMPFREALAIADSAARLGAVQPEDLAAYAQRMPRSGRRRVASVARHASMFAANPFESALRAIVIEAGISGFEPQREIHDKGFHATVDLGDPERRIVLEADSFAHHGSRQALDRDCHRYDELVSRGWRVLRFSWEQVMFRAQWVTRMVTATCGLPTCRDRSRR